MHHAYNTYTMDVIEALTAQGGFTLRDAKLFLVDRLDTLYQAYLQLLPPFEAVARLHRA